MLIGMLNRSRRVGRSWRSVFGDTRGHRPQEDVVDGVARRFGRGAHPGERQVEGREPVRVVDRPAMRGDSDDSGIDAKRPIDSAIFTASDQVPTGS